MSKNINIPFYTIKPANNIIDILLGKADFALVTPWVELPGVAKIPEEEFLKIKEIKNDKTTGYIVASPKIVFKNGETFTDRINFTEDAGERTVSTSLKPYGLYQTEKNIETYKHKFKVLQKITASRGIFKDTNTGLINECIINYQLSQAYELAYLLKILGINHLKPELDDKTIIIYIYSKLKINNNRDNEFNTLYNDYINFNSPSNTAKYIISYNSNLRIDHETDTIYSLFKILSTELRLKSQQINNNSNNSTNDQTEISIRNKKLYIQLLLRNKLKSISPACYVKEYSGNQQGKEYKGKSVYTDYTIKCAERSTSKTMIIVNGKIVPMTVENYFKMVDIPQLAKIYLSVDFDFRIYNNVEKQPVSIRYIVQVIACKPYEGANNFESIDIDSSLFNDLTLTDDTKNENKDDIANIPFDEM